MSDINQFDAFVVASGYFGNNDTYNNTSLPYLPLGSAMRASANLAETKCGVISSNTYKTLISVSGRGVLNFAGLISSIDSIYSFGIKITIDGVVIEKTGNPNNPFTGRGVPLIGGATQDLTNSACNGVRFDPTPFNTGFTIEIKSTQTTTDGLSILTNYRTFP